MCPCPGVARRAGWMAVIRVFLIIPALMLASSMSAQERILDSLFLIEVADNQGQRGIQHVSVFEMERRTEGGWLPWDGPEARVSST